LLARANDSRWGASRLLAEHLDNDNGVGINPVDDPPSLSLILNAKLMAGPADRRHRAGVREPKHAALLQLSEQKPGFDSRTSGEWRALDVPCQPNKRLVDCDHMQYDMSKMT
jgi:hypothetical protein